MKTLREAQIEQIRQLIDEHNHQFDAIVTFGYGPVEPGHRPGLGKLNLYGRINAIATGMLYQGFPVKTIIPTGGKTGGGDKPSEAKLIACLLQSKFDIPESVFILEEEAADTIFNIIYIANIIDRTPRLYQNLLFVALGCHLPRIREICTLIGLNGSFVAAETVLAIRSKRHQDLLLEAFQPANTNYANLVASQARGSRGLKELPEYWLPPLAFLNNSERLIKILQNPSIQTFLQSQEIDIFAKSMDNVRKKLSLITRKFPE
ncbi:MAG TPA: ElyC/SanA/YdcF family protein [Allocoleopsis sp.]